MQAPSLLSSVALGRSLTIPESQLSYLSNGNNSYLAGLLWD